MGFWSKLFGQKKKVRRPPSRGSLAVQRLARRRGCSVYDLDLYDDSIIEELLLLGLILSDDGYIDDPSWEEPVENEFVAEDVGTLEETVQEQPQPEQVVETFPLPAPPPPPPPVYEPEPMPEPEPEVERRWDSEPSSSDWSSSSDSGGWDSGGSDFGGGGGFDD